MWEKLTKIKVCENFDKLSKYYIWVIPPYGKSRKSKNDKQYVLMNVENNSFDRPLSTYGILFL